MTASERETENVRKTENLCKGMKEGESVRERKGEERMRETEKKQHEWMGK